ncbi:MAG: hypothetical protein LBE92_02915 [Chryseobacterium sp.]|jgi:hypothetical protein|uniref:hypothetical protein n=1 Tax=Chryseobacterium sp. TaxID=1871047 RepID=UPI00282229E6|nr:hypothetical protein [Chryseobacterium sp.]MDR2235050.1 hypothetical protein [Chryseobacterium sp.]
MIFEKPHIHQKFRTILAVVFTFCVLISSCAIKNGIRHLLSSDCAPVSQSSASKEKNNYQTPGPSVCKICKEKEILVKEQQSYKDFGFSDVPALAVFTFIVFCGAFLWPQLQKHPFYSTSKIGDRLPIFLQYRKLII